MPTWDNKGNPIRCTIQENKRKQKLQVRQCTWSWFSPRSPKPGIFPERLLPSSHMWADKYDSFMILNKLCNCQCLSQVTEKIIIGNYRFDTAVEFLKLEGREPDSPIEFLLSSFNSKVSETNLILLDCSSLSHWSSEDKVSSYRLTKPWPRTRFSWESLTPVQEWSLGMQGSVPFTN